MVAPSLFLSFNCQKWLHWAKATVLPVGVTTVLTSSTRHNHTTRSQYPFFLVFGHRRSARLFQILEGAGVGAVSDTSKNPRAWGLLLQNTRGYQQTCPRQHLREFWPGYRNLSFPDEAVIRMWEWSCPAQIKIIHNPGCHFGGQSGRTIWDRWQPYTYKNGGRIT